MEEYISMWRNFANFEDRTDRRGYWMAFLVNLIIGFVMGFIIVFLPPLSIIVWLYEIAILIPSISLQVRRLRDSGHRWYCIFLPFIPVVGAIILLVFLIQDSKYDPNDDNGGYSSYGSSYTV